MSAPKEVWIGRHQFGIADGRGFFHTRRTDETQHRYVRADIADEILKVLQRIKRQTGIDARDWEDINAAIAKAEGDH